MPRFVAAAKASAPAGDVIETPLGQLAVLEPCPIRPMNTRARVHWVFGSQVKYPQMKLIVSAPAVKQGDRSVYMLVKLSAVPTQKLAVDQLLQLVACDVRPIWTKTSGIVPERALVPQLCDRELALNLASPSSKRKRGAECLVWDHASVECAFNLGMKQQHFSFFFHAGELQAATAFCLRSRLVILDAEDPLFPMASFELLPTLSGLQANAGEHEIYVAVKVKVLDVSEISGDAEKPRRVMQVIDEGASADAPSGLAAGFRSVRHGVAWHGRGHRFHGFRFVRRMQCAALRWAQRLRRCEACCYAGHCGLSCNKHRSSLLLQYGLHYGV